MIKILVTVVLMTLAGTTLADFIVGGEEVQGNNWENVVAITDTNGNIFCSGTAIDSKTIKTAAHCLIDEQIVEYMTETIRPLFIAVDNPNLSKEEMTKNNFKEAMITEILKNQELLKENPEFSKQLASSPVYKYVYIYSTLDRIFINYAKNAYRIYLGNGNIGGKVTDANYKIADVKISESYLAERAMKSALKLGLDPKKDADFQRIFQSVLNEKNLDNLTFTVEEELPISNYIPSLSPEEVSEIDYKTVQLVGFGRTIDPNLKEKDENFGVKREVTVDYMGFSNIFSNFVTHMPNKSACYGDSGGSAFVKLVSGEWRYLGVISSGIGLNKDSKKLEVDFSLNKKDGQCGSAKVATLIVPAYL